MKLEVGSVYRRRDIQDYYGGQRQGGISTPAEHNGIFIFSSDVGHAFGYADGWTEEGRFLYTGEGQVGDMEFVRGNLAIRDHEANGKKLLLFIYVRQAHVRFEGEMRCVDYEIFRTPDRDKIPRNGIRFILARIGDSTGDAERNPKQPRKNRKPNITERQGLVTSRVGQGYYRQELLRKYDCKCAVTGLGLSEVLIASHIVPWRASTDEERLDVENGILLSPNYDALFDRGLISFDDEGVILISKLLSDDFCDRLKIDREASISVTDGMRPYLARHREALR